MAPVETNHSSGRVVPRAQLLHHSSWSIFFAYCTGKSPVRSLSLEFLEISIYVFWSICTPLLLQTKRISSLLEFVMSSMPHMLLMVMLRTIKGLECLNYYLWCWWAFWLNMALLVHLQSLLLFCTSLEQHLLNNLPRLNLPNLKDVRNIHHLVQSKSPWLAPNHDVYKELLKTFR